MNIQIGDSVLAATFVENSSVDALKEALSQSPITVNMRDYGNMEKVAPLGMDLPRNNEQITRGRRHYPVSGKCVRGLLRAQFLELYKTWQDQ